MNPDPPTEDDSAPSDGKIRQRRLNAILSKWMEGVGPVYFQRIPKQDLLDSGIPREELERSGLITPEGSSGKAINLPTICGFSQFSRIVLDELKINKSRQDIAQLANKSWLKPFKMPNGKLKTYVALQACRDHWGNGEAGSGEETDGDIKRDRQRIAREKDKIELEEIQRRQSETWMLTAVHLFEMSAFGAIVKNTAQDVIERQMERPDLFDQFQAEIARRVDELIEDAEKTNRAQKAAMK